jgi:hypothetical protein
VFKILQYSEMECNCAKKITEVLLESTVRCDVMYIYESPMTVSTFSHTLAAGPLNFEAVGLNLPNL